MSTDMKGKSGFIVTYPNDTGYESFTQDDRHSFDSDTGLLRTTRADGATKVWAPGAWATVEYWRDPERPRVSFV